MDSNEPAKHPFDEVVAATLRYFNGDELAARVWASKYALKDSFGNLYELTPDDMHHRLASRICSHRSQISQPSERRPNL